MTPRRIRTWAIAPLLLTTAAAAAPTDPTSTDLSDSAKLVTLASKARAAAVVSSDAATKAKDEATTLALQRKPLLTELATARRDHKRHLTAARAAAQRYQQRAQAGTLTPADDTLLATARTEYTAAADLATTIRNTTKAIRKIEETLAARLTDAATAAAAAQTRVPEAQQQSTDLNALVTRARTEAQTASGAVSSSAISTRGKAALTPSTYAARRTKLATDDGKLSMTVGITEAKVAEAQAKLGGFATEDRLAKQATTPGACDIKKVDWANRAYPAGGSGIGPFILTKGEGANEYGIAHMLEKVSYLDMNGNGTPEAFVPIQSPGGPRGSYHLTVFVYETDKSCITKEVYRIDGGPYAGAGQIKGKAYVIERSQIGEMGMPGEPEVVTVTFKGGKYEER